MPKVGITVYHSYAIILVIAFILFNVIAFAAPTDKTTAFWIAYAFTVIAFALQIGIWNLAFKASETLKSKFLGIPIIYVSVVYFTLQLIAFAVVMIFPLIESKISSVKADIQKKNSPLQNRVNTISNELTKAR